MFLLVLTEINLTFILRFLTQKEKRVDVRSVGSDSLHLLISLKTKLVTFISKTCLVYSPIALLICCFSIHRRYSHGVRSSTSNWSLTLVDWLQETKIKHVDYDSKNLDPRRSSNKERWLLYNNFLRAFVSPDVNNNDLGINWNINCILNEIKLFLNKQEDETLKNFWIFSCIKCLR